MSYTSKQRNLLDQLDDANFHIGKVKNKLRHLEDDLYALEKHRVDVLKALEDFDIYVI
tara:strand:- start:223 stop:396 length:174 start_codon:yes stop_codon:yes gene_type:complete